jgi:threonine/homoserine/homoserine lactone efflux protein
MSVARGPQGLASFYFGHTLADWVWYGAVSALVVSGRNILNGQAYAWVTGVCGLLLAGFGLYFIYLGLRQLRVVLAPAGVTEARA